MTYMSAVLGSLNDFDELPGVANIVGEMLNKYGTSTYPEQEFSDIINSLLPAAELENVLFPLTDEDKQIFSFDVNASHLIPALEM